MCEVGGGLLRGNEISRGEGRSSQGQNLERSRKYKGGQGECRGDELGVSERGAKESGQSWPEARDQHGSEKQGREFENKDWEKNMLLRG